jgi:hypothetical protein
LAEEARRERIPFGGHVPRAVTSLEASQNRQHSIEHLSAVSIDVCTSAAEIRRKTQEANDAEDAVKARDGFYQVNQMILHRCNSAPEKRLFQAFLRHDTWQVPTLVVLRAYTLIHDPDFTRDPRVQYIPKDLLGFWAAMGGAPDPRNDEIQKQLFERNVRMVGALHKAGVPLLAGTDTPNPYTFPGFSLHEELELMVKAGLTPMEALQTATRNPARYLGRSAQLGTVATGKVADLVVLDANPLEDISNTKKIDAVVLHGRLFRKSDLNKMLDDVKQKNQN